EHLANAWTIWASERPVEVELRFAPSVAKRIGETRWHDSQKLTALADGHLLMRLRVSSTTELKHWVLGWGAGCEVLLPAEFRKEIEAEVAVMTRLYTAVEEPLAALRQLVASATRSAPPRERR